MSNIYTCTYVHTYTVRMFHVCELQCTYVRIARICTYMHINTSTDINTCIYMHIRTYVHIWIYVHIRAYTCIYMHTCLSFSLSLESLFLSLSPSPLSLFLSLSLSPGREGGRLGGRRERRASDQCKSECTRRAEQRRALDRLRRLGVGPSHWSRPRLYQGPFAWTVTARVPRPGGRPLRP